MSETVHYKGKLIRADKLPNETLEEQCKRILELIGQCTYCEVDEFYTSYAEMLTDEYYQQYIIHRDDLYQIEYRSLDMDDGIFITKPIPYGYEFEVKYYNGGCGFSEAIGYALNNSK